MGLFGKLASAFKRTDSGSSGNSGGSPSKKKSKHEQDVARHNAENMDPGKARSPARSSPRRGLAPLEGSPMQMQVG